MPSAARLLVERNVTLLSLDLDDTLLDTDAAAEARLEAAARRAADFLPRLDARLARDAVQAGLRADPITQGRVGALAAALGLDPRSEAGVAIRRAYNDALIDLLAWMEGAEAILARLRERYRLAIVTNGPSDLQWPKLRKFGLQDLVDYVVVSGDQGIHKPDPAIFSHLLALATAEASAAAHVGDSIHTDIAGARAAGLTAIWYPPRLRTPDDPGDHTPDAIIERLDDLLEEVEELAEQVTSEAGA